MKKVQLLISLVVTIMPALEMIYHAVQTSGVLGGVVGGMAVGTAGHLLFSEPIQKPQ